MNDLVRILIVMEMVGINLYVVDLCASRRSSGLFILSVQIGFTAVLTFFTRSLWSVIGFDQGNAAFALIGIVYLFPLIMLYRESLSHLISILFSTWIYTLLIYCISVQTAYLFPDGLNIMYVLGIQSFLYILTFHAFSYWVKNGLLFMLSNIAKSSRYILLLVSLSWFLSIIIINASIIYPENQLITSSAAATLITNPVLSYLLLYSMVANQKEVKALEEIVYMDNLTGLFNRAKLFKDTTALLHSKTPFRLVFIDLNHFKQVNDQFGHSEGDQYLIRFSRELESMLEPSEQLYRMSGDEFIIISQSSRPEALIQKLQSFPSVLECIHAAFLGLSLGLADYPAEESTIDKLITLADKRMYENKPQNSR